MIQNILSFTVVVPNFGTLESHQGVNSMNDKKEQIRHGNYANYNG